MVNLLFPSAGRRVELLRAFKRAYASLELDGCVVATDIDPLAPALRVVDRAHIVPPIASPGYVPALIELCRRYRIDLVVPLLDPDVSVLAVNRAALEATGARVAVVPSDAAAIVSDKRRTQEFFQGQGLRTPASWAPSELEPSRASYPLFVKPRKGSAGKDAHKVMGPAELEFYLERVPEPIIQEFLEGPEITSDVVCDLDGKVLAVVSRRRLEVRNGEVAKGVTISDPAIQDACVSIATELPAVGPITVQCIMHGAAPHFTEINGRLGGGVPLAIAAGVDVPAMLLAMAAGLPVPGPPLGCYATGLYLTRFDESFVVTEDERDQMARSHF
jgi:carbamoyl-phosphate synthase large subunit